VQCLLASLFAFIQGISILMHSFIYLFPLFQEQNYGIKQGIGSMLTLSSPGLLNLLCGEGNLSKKLVYIGQHATQYTE
jgi:hypothetical protein